MDDETLEKQLQEILDLAGAAALEAGRDIDILPIRNEIEESEDRLAGFIRENRDDLAARIEANAEAIQRVHDRLEEIAGTVEAIQAELPAN